MVVIEFPKPRAMPWRVVWQDWRDHHDWVGRRSLRPGTPRVPTPPREARRFRTKESAEKFVTRLRLEVPADELVVQILGTSKPAPRPMKPLLPGDWPLQRRGDTSPTQEIGPPPCDGEGEPECNERGLKSCEQIETFRQKSTLREAMEQRLRPERAPGSPKPTSI